MHHNFIARNFCKAQRIKFFAYSTSKILHFLIQITYGLQDNFANINMPNQHFYLPQAIGHWYVFSLAFV